MSSARQTNWLNVLFRTRVKVCHQQTTILNLSLVFSPRRSWPRWGC